MSSTGAEEPARSDEVVSMYVPQAFAQPDVATLQATMRTYPLATIVMLTPDGLEANHIPLLLDEQPGPFGTLRGHVARANPIWQKASDRIDALVMFHGPDAYISPSWYPTLQETGRAVPTWNYIVVHAHGRPRFIEDASWLRVHVEALTAAHENGREPSWQVSGAPADYIESMVRGIVGVEMPIARLVGKWKVSQNRTERDRDAVIRALGEQDGDAAAAIADAVRASYRRSTRA